MKNLICLFFIVSSLYCAEENIYNSFQSHYNQEDYIIVQNFFNETICCFNEHYIMTDDGIKFYHIGYVIRPWHSRKIYLNNIVSSEKVNYLEVYLYDRILSLIKQSDDPISLPRVTFKIEVGLTYEINAKSFDKVYRSQMLYEVKKTN